MDHEVKFKVDEPVRKVTGDYHLDGVVVGHAWPKPGVVRYVVRHDVGEDGWFLHVYSEKNLVSRRT
jgi:hypothetical protein